MTGTSDKPKKISLAQGLHMALDEAMAADEAVIALGEDVGDEQGGGVFKITAGLSTKYGKHRIRATPISEQAIIGAAVGAAIAGLRPVAEIMLMNFVTVAMDQIVNHAAKLRFMSGGQTHVPLVIRTTTGVGVGFGGQHSDMLEAWFAHVPGLRVVMASNPADAYGLLASAIEDDDPVILIENILSYGIQGPPPTPGYRVPLGKAAVTREGDDVSIITYGRAVLDALAVAEKLAGEGISVEVVDLRTIAPFDEATVIASVGKTGRAVVLHEAVKAYGTGAEISSRIHEVLFDRLKAPVARIGGTYSPVPFSKPLEAAWVPNQEQVVAAIRSTLDWKRTLMATELRMPKLGMSTTEAVLQEWLVADGAAVEAGTPIYAVETDKSTTEIEAQAAGTLRHIGEVDETYAVGTLIGMIE